MQIRVGAILLLLFAATILTAQDGNDLFQQGLVRQTANGDIQGAIRIYERVVRDFPGNRSLVAKALVQLGRCYELLGQARSREYFEQVLTKYVDEADMVAEARTRLAARANSPLQIATPSTDDPFSFAISPDGRRVVFAVTAAGRGVLWLHDLATGKAAPIAGADLVRSSIAPAGGAAPFWSPDGTSIGFFSDQRLKRIAAAGGTAQTLADAPAPAGGTWNRDGVIVFTPSVFGLSRIPATGNGPAVAFGMGRNSHPQFLPDGRHFLFHTLSEAAAIGQPTQVLRVGSLDEPDVKPLTVQTLAGVFAAPDQLLHAPGAGLFARRLDLQALELNGTSNHLLERVAVAPSGTVAVSASASGTLVYRANVPAAERQFAWLDRQGRPTGHSFVPDPAAPCCARISPDGRAIAFGRIGTYGLPVAMLWTIADVVGAQAQPLYAVAQASVWSSTGDGLIFGLWRLEPPVSNLFSNLGELGMLRESDEDEQPTDWSRDGRFLLYETIVGGDLMALPLEPSRPLSAGVPIPVAQTPAAERNGRFSPDGKWVAYQSNAVGGRNEIFVQPFPGSPDARRRVSVNGGTFPVWRGDGREIYFLSPDFHLMVVAVTFSENAGVVFGMPAPLFPVALPIGSEYDAASDGQRFLVNRPVRADTPPIVVLANWNRAKP